MSYLHIRNPLSASNNDSIQRHCVLLGHQGNGKTALKNKLCGTSHLSEPCSSSLTRNLYLNPVSVGDGAFSIIDTPGIGSSAEVFKHAWLNYKALTTYELNTVFIVAKYENRYEDICNNIDNAIGLFDNDECRSNEEYAKNIVLLVSHFDQALNPSKEFQAICKHLEQFNVFNVVAYSVNHDTELLANSLFACVSNMDRISIKMTWEIFFANFPLNFRSELREIRKDFTQAENAISNILTCFLEIINYEISSILEEEKDEWLQSVIVAHREFCHNNLYEFQSEHTNTMQELDLYAAYIDLQQKIIKQEEKLVHVIRSLMSFDITNPNNPKNLIKKCPYCGLVWWKVVGCDGQTTCGNREWDKNESEHDLLKGSQLFKYRFNWSDNRKRKITYKKSQRAALSNVFNNSTSDSQINVEQQRPQGCGSSFVWSELPTLPDKEWQEIMRITTIDSVVKIIQQDIGSLLEKQCNTYDDKFYQ